MRTTTPSLTDLPVSRQQEERGRTIQYLVTMAIRLVCLGAAVAIALIAPSWWIVVPIAGAVLLPFFAVVLANAPRAVRGTVERPGPLALDSGRIAPRPDDIPTASRTDVGPDDRS